MHTKVFVGPNNTGSNAALVAMALRSKGITADSFSYSNHPYLVNTDFVIKQFQLSQNYKFLKKFKFGIFISVLNMLLRFMFVLKSLIKYDIFIFISAYTILRNKKDLTLLKYFNKKICFLFVGCQERDPESSINNTKSNVCGKCFDMNFQKSQNCNDVALKRKIIENLSYYADYIFAFRDLVDFIPKSITWNQLYFVTTNPFKTKNQLLSKYDELDVINITHLTTNSTLKGSKYINKAMANLSKKFEGKINYNNTPINHKDIADVLGKTHIFIDQFNGYYALLCLEALSLGCVVMCQMQEWFLNDIKTEDIPIININTKNIEIEIEKLLIDKANLKEIGKNSINYFNKYHSLEPVGEYYKRIMDLH